MPDSVGQNAPIIGSLVLMGLIVVLWYAFNHIQSGSPKVVDQRTREFKERRERLLSYLASLDHRYENRSLDRLEYLRQREQGKRQLRRISMLLKK